MKDNLNGQKFGKLTVLEQSEEKTKDGRYPWLCRCDCGEQILVAGKTLKNGERTSCKQCSGWKSKSLIGQKFNKLSPVSFSEETNKYLCNCDCGKTCLIMPKDLLGNKRKSCGCLKSVDLLNQKINNLLVINGPQITNSVKYWFCTCDICKKDSWIPSAGLLNRSAKDCGCTDIYPIGEKFNRLTVKFDSSQRSGGAILYECICECGNIKYVTITNLKTGTVTGCGKCHRSSIPRELAGQRFGMLEIVKKIDNIGTKTAWEARCDCGKICSVKTGDLVTGHSKSCGCQINYNKINHIGQIFGRLEVKEIFGVQYGHKYYRCECSCGNECLIDGSQLVSGKTRSCGCLQKDLASARMKLRTGDKNHFWRGGVSDGKDRQSLEYKNWRAKIYEKYNKCCDNCGDDKNPCAHHLDSFKDFPDRRFDVQNGVCLCEDCHLIFHILYGKESARKDHYYSFKERCIRGDI